MAKRTTSRKTSPGQNAGQNVGQNGHALARPGDPLVLNDGTIVHEDPKPRPLDARKSVDPATFRPQHKRNLNELPAPPKTMNVVAVVFLYTMMGVGDREIADALGTTVPELDAMRQHTAYAEAFEAILNTFISSNSDMLQSRIAAYSHDALTSMAQLSSEGKMERSRFEASRDLLDRAGVSPKEVMMKNAQSMSGMRIIMVDGDAKVNIEVEPEMDLEDDY